MTNYALAVTRTILLYKQVQNHGNNKINKVCVYYVTIAFIVFYVFIVYFLERFVNNLGPLVIFGSFLNIHVTLRLAILCPTIGHNTVHCL